MILKKERLILSKPYLTRGVLLLVVLFYNLFGFTQEENKKFTHSIGLSLFKVETNRPTFNEDLEAKFYSGLQYEAKRGSFGINADFEYAANTINDFCKNCPDATYGKGHLSELNLVIGGKFFLFEKKVKNFIPFIELDGYASRMNYWGDFQGGFLGTGTEFNHLYYAFGGMLQVGLNIKLIKGLFFNVQSSVRMGTAQKSVNHHFLINPTYERTYDNAITPFHFSIGYNF